MRVWRQRNLTLEGKITIFKTLAISQIVYNAFLSSVPKYVIDTLKRIQNDFLWNGKKAKIKHLTLCNSYEMGGLQSVDIEIKIKALQLSWISRLYDSNDHQWKTIPKYYLESLFGNHIFYPQFSPKLGMNLSPLPLFYQNMIIQWKDCSSPLLTARNIVTHCLWHNHYLKIANNTFHFKGFEVRNLNYIYQLFNNNGSVKTWNQISEEFTLDASLHFKYLQIVNAIPPSWKRMIFENIDTPYEITSPTRGIQQCTRTILLEKLQSKQFYIILIRNRNHTPTAKIYFNEKYSNIDTKSWLQIDLLPRKTTRNSYARIFQYKLLNNILYLNDKLFLFGKSETNLCSFCRIEIETTSHLFSECSQTLLLWSQLKEYLSPHIILDDLNTQSALLGLYNDRLNNYLLVNHLLLIFKLYIYKSRKSFTLRINDLKNEIIDIANIELKSTILTPEFSDIYTGKWNPINSIVSS